MSEVVINFPDNVTRDVISRDEQRFLKCVVVDILESGTPSAMADADTARALFAVIQRTKQT